MSFAAIVASLHGRTGKTLLARVLAEYFILSGRRPLLFDTDAAECRLCASYPHEAIVVDLNRVPDQMALFDNLAAVSPEARVVDVSHQSFGKFFRVMHEIDFIGETRALGVAPHQAAVFETTPAGVTAGRSGGFDLVVGVDPGGTADALRGQGADVVVTNLVELFDRRRGA